MADRDAAERDLIRSRLAQSRAELRTLLDPPPGESGGGAAGMNGHAGFPRSHTMQMLLSSRGLGALGALAGGLLIARPALALRLLRFVPVSAVGKMLMAKAVSALKSKPPSAQ
jgi:hypothetical protein